jgi:hypothetical protein
MRIIPRISGAALAVALVLSGCVPTTTPAGPSSPRPSTTPVFANEAEALAAATKAYAAYVRVSDEILADGGKNPERINAVVTGKARKTAMQGFTKFRDGSLTSTGSSKISNLIREYYVPNSAGGVGIFSAYACLDISEIDVLDGEGNSVVTPTRPNFQAFELTFDLATNKAPMLLVASETPWNGEGVCTS